MGRELRRSTRIPVRLTATLILRDGKTSEPLADPLMGSLKDVSSHGVRIQLPRIRSGQYHLFYAMGEMAIRLMTLELIDPEEFGRLVIPVRPVWFDRLLSDPSQPFELGLEFLVGPDDSCVARLGTLLALPKGGGGGWLRGLFGAPKRA